MTLNVQNYIYYSVWLIDSEVGVRVLAEQVHLKPVSRREARLSPDL